MTKKNCTSINSPKQVKKVHGVGYNSGGIYKAQTIEYDAWCGMLARCYSAKFQRKRPTYIGCTVADEWHDFQVFAEWYVNHKYYGMGYQLDKDLLVRGNKVYSPSLCCLVPLRINSLFVDSRSRRGAYPIGVDFKRGKFRAQIRKDGRKVDLGCFSTAEEAHQAYIASKMDYAKEVAKSYKGMVLPRVYQALMNWSY